MSEDATTAVLAHGLLNAVHVVGSVPELLLEGPSDTEATRLCKMLVDQLDFIVTSLEDLGDVANESLRQALTRASLAGERVADACETGRIADATDVLRSLDDAVRRAAADLRVIVLGLPTDVIAYLDTLEASS